MKKAKKKDFVLLVRCTVIKEIIVCGCTEEQAIADPFKYSVDECELEMPDWEVISIKPND